MPELGNGQLRHGVQSKLEKDYPNYGLSLTPISNLTPTPEGEQAAHSVVTVLYVNFSVHLTYAVHAIAHLPRIDRALSRTHKTTNLQGLAQ